MTDRRNAIVRWFVSGAPGRDWTSLLLFIGLTAFYFVFLANLDLVEWFQTYVQSHEDWEVDELILLPLIWTFVLLFHALRRWFQIEGEMAKRVAAEKELASMNAQLERKVDERTERLQQAFQHLSAAQERYELAAEGAHDGLWDWDLATDEFHYSALCARMLGCGEIPDDMGADMGAWLNRVDPVSREAVRSELERQRKEGGSASFEFRVNDPERKALRWIECRSAAAQTGAGDVTRIAGALRDVTEYRAVDTLTGLANRSLFGERLSQALRRYRESPAATFAVLFMDLDRFKDVNDSLGHAVGDALLIEVSRRLQLSLRGSDTLTRLASRGVVARLGGDEFAALLEDVQSAEDAVAVGQRLLKQVSSPAMVEGHTIRPSASAGIALATNDYESPEEMLRDADTAMYVSKSKGRGQVELFVPSMRHDLLKSLEIETELANALPNRELFIEYQPQVALADESLKGFEALLRWRHPRFGLVSPSVFIPIAERTGAILEIGDWVLNEVCRQTAEWLREGILGEGCRVSVNVSAKQLEAGDYPQRVMEALRTFSISASHLTMEITESALIGNSHATLRGLAELKGLGIRLDIGDFVTGYSTFEYFCRLPFDVLKIDRRLVHGLDAVSTAEIVKSLIALSNRLGLEVIAEGVETADQLEKLRSLGCESAQGYYFAAPLTHDKARSWLGGETRLETQTQPELTQKA